MTYYLLNHGPHLVDLNGINKEILRCVIVFLGGVLEAFRNLLDTVVENIGKAQKNRCRHVTYLKLVHQFLKVYFGKTLLGRDHHVAFLIDGKIFSAPAVDIVQLGAVFNSPFSHFSFLAFLVGLISRINGPLNDQTTNVDK